MTAWTCAFCGRADVPRTREHILRKDFLGKIPHVTGARVVKDYPSFPELGVKVTEFPLTNFDMTINEVCADCNNGWMNDLEAKVEEMVVALANGAFRDLTGAEVEALRFWMVKTALVKTLQNRESGRLTRLLDEMYRIKRAPKYVSVQFGICSGPAPNPSGRHIWMSITPPEKRVIKDGRPRIDAHHRLDLVVFGLGRLFFAVTLPTTKKMSGLGYVCTRVMRNHGVGWNVLQEGSKRPLVLKRVYMDPDAAYINGSVLRQMHEGQTDVHDTGWEPNRPPVNIGCIYLFTEEEIEAIEAGEEVYQDPERWLMWNANGPSPYGPEFDDVADMLRRESTDEGPAARRARERRERRGA